MKGSAVTLSVLAWCALACPAYSQLLQTEVNHKWIPLAHAKEWRQDSADTNLPLHFKTKIKPTELQVGQDHPNGTKIRAMLPGYGVNLPLDFHGSYKGDFQGFDEFGDLSKGYYVQVAEHDFDGDGEPEIVVAVGNGSTDLAVNVIKYRAPKLAKQAGDEKNWLRIGSFDGQAKAIINGKTITLPYGSAGLYEEYTWKSGKFAKSAVGTP